MRFEHLQDWLDWQQTLHSEKIKLGLERVARVARELGLMRPDFRVVMVSGTNGKGSITAILESIYHEAGYRVAAYTSPHLLHYNERIRIGKKNVEDAPLCAAFDLVDQARGDLSLSYFEFGTLAAMQIFSTLELDVAVFEVGLGGRLDAVNIYDADAAIISSVGLDHVQWLGSTREAIGLEKAGIFRTGQPAVCGDSDPPETLLKYARDIDSRLYLVGEDFSYRQGSDGHWSFQNAKLDWDNLPAPNLYGDVQVANAAAALMSIQCLDEVLPVQRESVERGLQNICLSGRFQRVVGKCEMIFDVAHNLDSAKVLGKNLLELGPASRTYAVFSVLEDKDVEGIIGSVCEQIDEWYISELDSERSLACADLQDCIVRLDPEAIVHACPSVEQAWQAVNKGACETSRIVVFGSFLTVAEVLSFEL
ncbi:MAG: bifunctional tetrahydrofolate synthase/dihydrofolate synthase [Gammaproteobacteria bacterium]|nr:bifunctional tetrahydrofolate synthase/dihydrofolate synthase [Gammaproteobacteria bacterium]